MPLHRKHHEHYDYHHEQQDHYEPECHEQPKQKEHHEPECHEQPKQKEHHEPECHEHHKQEHHEPECHEHHEPHTPSVPKCGIETVSQIPLTNMGTTPVNGAVVSRIKVPVVLIEPTLQIVLESNVQLHPVATEIKRVKKDVFLDQVKLLPVGFTRIGTTDYFNVTRAKLFIASHIRKNIEYASYECNGVIQDRIADVPFTGFSDITTTDFINHPIVGIAEGAQANFLNEKTNMDARLDKSFFQSLVKYNEQPFGELVAANFFELDFSPKMATPEGCFSNLTEKIVMDLTLKVLQVQQIAITGTQVVPSLFGLTPP